MYSQHDAYELLVNWQNKYLISNALAAVVMGRSRRTVMRWRQQKRAPLWVAHLIDHAERGKWITSTTKRGAWHCGRDNEIRDFLFKSRTGKAITKGEPASRPGPSRCAPGTPRNLEKCPLQLMKSPQSLNPQRGPNSRSHGEPPIRVTVPFAKATADNQTHALLIGP